MTFLQKQTTTEVNDETDQITSMSNMTVEVNNKTEQLTLKRADSQSVFVIGFSVIFVFFIMFLVFGSLYFYQQFLDFNNSLLFILFLFRHMIPDYRKLQNQYEKNINISTKKFSPKSILKKPFKKKLKITKTVSFSEKSAKPDEIIEMERQTSHQDSDTAIINECIDPDIICEMDKIDEERKNVGKESKAPEDPPIAILPVETSERSPPQTLTFKANVHASEETHI